MPRSLLLAALLLLVPAAQAQDWNDADPTELARIAAHRAHNDRLIGSLVQDGGARELALAAILRGLVNMSQDPASAGDTLSQAVQRDPQAVAWLRRAGAGAGDDVIANQLLVATAKTGDDDLRRAAAQRWRDADPGNLVPLLHAGLTADALLAAARDATVADARMYEGARWIMAAWRRHPPTAAELSALSAGEPYRVEEAAALSAMALWTAVAMPGWVTLAEACSADMLRALPARGNDCRHVARLLADESGSVADEQVGLAMLRALASSPEERSGLEARKRSLDWRMLQWGAAAQQQPRDGAEQFVRLLADPSIHSEQQLVERVLQEAGIPLEPPAGWMRPRR